MSDVQFDSAILDADLDDLQDLPEFKNFPVGVHAATLRILKKVVNNKSAIEFNFVARETIELAKPEDEPVKAGDSCSCLYFLDNEFGQGALKKDIKPIAAYMGTSKLGEIINAFDKDEDGAQYADGLDVAVTTSLTKPNKNGDVYLKIMNISVD